MTWFSIHPRDVWLFRDGKPFTAGEDNLARSMFPPTPLTVQGALRQKISEAHDLSYGEYKKNKSPKAQKVGEYIGTVNAQKDGVDTGAFRMRGPFVGLIPPDKPAVALLPCPADLLMNEDSDNLIITQPDDSLSVSDLRNGENVELNQSLAHIRFVQVYKDYENMANHWITGEVFKQYLDGQVTTQIAPSPEQIEHGDVDRSDNHDVFRYIGDKHGYQIFPSHLVFGTQNRMGVSTDSATSFRHEGQLYQVQFVRPTRHIGLLVDVGGGHEANHITGLMTMGGEQRESINRDVDVLDFPESPSQITGRFKIIFLTPAYFEDGWLPTNGDWSQWFGNNVTLVGSALYRPQKIGGWSNAKGGARAMHNYVAPGSVYYFETSDTVNTSESITQNPPNIKHANYIGFGQVAYAKW